MVRKMINGKQVRMYFDTKPSKKEIENKIYELKSQTDPSVKGTFQSCAEAYIRNKENVLSVSTVDSYYSILRNLPDTFLALKMAQITQVDVQTVINTYSLKRSPKSVRNASGFITAVIWYFRPDLQLHTTLPQKVKKDIYIPTEEEAKKILQEVAGTDYELVTHLCMCGLRKSEALAVTSKDLDENNYLRIDKALVKNKDNEYVIKTAKTESSVRIIWIPDNIATLLRQQGIVYGGFPGNVLRNLKRIQRRLGMPSFRLHDLRHFYISYAHSLGIADASIAETVGHKNVATTRAVYLHNLKDKQTEMQQKVANSLFSD